jgi:dsRNA-specific ribonuclease
LTDTHWPEGYLSAKKDAIVSNSRLCKAAIEHGLDKFILTKVFTGSKWRPLYVDGLLEDPEDRTREMASKTIADVVESLIGAGWKMGGFPTSLPIVKVFLPELDLPSLEVGRTQLYNLAPADIPLPENLRPLETLAGYSFKKKSLLVQAISHSSYSTAIASYERLEFLGDAILEIIIVTELLTYEDKLSHSLMHLYKTALVNGDYLSFIALEWNITQERTDLKEDLKSRRMKEVQSKFSLALWRFMRHGLPSVGTRQGEVEGRHASVRRDILDAIESGTHFPWTLLAKIHANKFYSDLVESLLAAVWVDSGSMDACKEVLNRMGILQYLRRIILDRVHVLHPREELGILADDKEVRYDVQVRKMDNGSDEWTCTIFVGETDVVEVAQGVSGDEVRTRAAEKAVFSLRSADGRSGSPVAYGQRITRCRQG